MEEYESSPECVRGVGVAENLVRAIRQIRQVRNRLFQIELEIATLIDSDMAKLRAKADAARMEGRDLLSEMAEGVKRRIDVYVVCCLVLEFTCLDAEIVHAG